jgi:hypothetical protein
METNGVKDEPVDGLSVFDLFEEGEGLTYK